MTGSLSTVINRVLAFVLRAISVRPLTGRHAEKSVTTSWPEFAFHYLVAAWRSDESWFESRVIRATCRVVHVGLLGVLVLLTTPVLAL